MRSQNHTPSTPLWWVILVVLGLAGATCWWFGREIKSIDQQIEIIKKK